jgi:hypothetical protein
MKFKIRKTIILSVVLYGCETWSLTLREEQRLRVFEDRALRKIFGPKREQVSGSWRRLHSEEFHKSVTGYYYNDQVKKDEMGGACSTYGRDEKRIQNFGRKT